MNHSYDLLLQSTAPSQPAPLEALVAALVARGATVSAEGVGTWKLSHGEVDVAPLREEGQVRGLDLHVPFKDRSELVEAVARALVEIAETTGTRATDPQRGETLSLTNTAALVDEYLRMARYAGEYGGVSDALGLSSYAQPAEETSTTARWLLMLVVFVLALYVTWKVVTGLQASTLSADEPPADVNVPAKIRRP